MSAPSIRWCSRLIRRARCMAWCPIASAGVAAVNRVMRAIMRASKSFRKPALKISQYRFLSPDSTRLLSVSPSRGIHQLAFCSSTRLTAWRKRSSVRTSVVSSPCSTGGLENWPDTSRRVFRFFTKEKLSRPQTAIMTATQAVSPMLLVSRLHSRVFWVGANNPRSAGRIREKKS